MTTKKIERLVQRLFERNPNADREALADAFVEHVRGDPALREEALTRYFEDALPLIEKLRAGKKLTAEERRRWKMLGGE